MQCLNCGEPMQDGFHQGSPFCDGSCKHEYRSGQDPDLCVHCQDRKATKTGAYVGYCSMKCQRLHDMARAFR